MTFWAQPLNTAKWASGFVHGVDNSWIGFAFEMLDTERSFSSIEIMNALLSE